MVGKASGPSWVKQAHANPARVGLGPTNLELNQGRAAKGRRRSPMLSRGGLLAVLPFIALGQAPLQAQSVGNALPSSPAPRSGGPPADRGSINLTLDTRYDSNIARIGDNVPNTRGLTAEDIRISPAIFIDYAKNIGRHRAGVTANLGYDFYVNNSRLNAERINVQPFVDLDLPVCDLSLSIAASRRRSDLGELTFVTGAELISGNNLETIKRFNGALTCGERYGLQPTFSYTATNANNSNFLRRTADYRSRQYRPGVAYESPGLGRIGLFAVAQDTDLPFQFDAAGRSTGYHSKGAGVSYSRSSGIWTFDGSLYFNDLQPFDPLVPSRKGVNGSAQLNIVATPRLQITAAASRDFTSSLTSNATYEVIENYSLRANYAASERLRLRLGGFVQPRSLIYASAPANQIIPLINQQTRKSIYGGASLDLSRRLRLSVDTGYEKLESNSVLFDYDDYYVSVGFAFRI